MEDCLWIIAKIEEFYFYRLKAGNFTSEKKTTLPNCRRTHPGVWVREIFSNLLKGVQIMSKQNGYFSIILVIAIGILYSVSSSHVSAAPGDVVLSFPAPGSSPQGLAWDGKYLWVVDDSTDRIYKLDPSNGAVLLSLASIGSDPRGLVWDGKCLWNSDNSSHKIYRLDSAKGSMISAIDAPVMEVKRGISPLGGLTWDGNYLWSGWIAGWSSRMNQVNPKDGSVNRFIFTKGVPRALASDGKFLWSATDNGGIRLGIIYQYDLSTELEVTHFDAPGYYPTGLTFEGKNLWCADKVTRKIYKLVVRQEE